MAQKADISRTALYQIECGKTEAPRAGTIRRIARALEVPVERLLGQESIEAAPISAATAGEVFAGALESTLPDRFEGFRGRAYPERIESISAYGLRAPAPSRETEILLKLREVLASPLGESVSRIVEESYRMLPALRSV